LDFWKICAYRQGTVEPDLESAREHACSKELVNVDQNSSSNEVTNVTIICDYYMFGWKRK
jgi:hypothetical protein